MISLFQDIFDGRCNKKKHKANFLKIGSNVFDQI